MHINYGHFELIVRRFVMFYGALKHDNDRFKLPTNTESTWHISTHILTHSQNNNAEIASTHRSPFSQSTHKKSVFRY